MILLLPPPPSVNKMFANRKRGSGRGRYPTKLYSDWKAEAGWRAKLQRPERVAGPYRLTISLPKVRGDIDNRIKAINDLLVSLNLVDDDRHCASIIIGRRQDNGLTEVHVTPMTP